MGSPNIVAAASPRFVAYKRVGTARQGSSGLWLATQRKSIDDFAFSVTVRPDRYPFQRHGSRSSTLVIL